LASFVSELSFAITCVRDHYASSSRPSSAS
jgi:hypothetical protein